jgi:transcriptional regulator of heat shock response|tara:strand:+ start:226 stop:534 length:309 start_codon:yes stop_codon:yes gene_type:complete
MKSIKKDPQVEQDKLIEGLVDHLEEINKMFCKNFDTFSNLNQLKLVRIINQINANSVCAMVEELIEVQTKATDLFQTMTEEELEEVDQHLKSKLKPKTEEIN